MNLIRKSRLKGSGSLLDRRIFPVAEERRRALSTNGRVLYLVLSFILPLSSLPTSEKRKKINNAHWPLFLRRKSRAYRALLGCFHELTVHYSVIQSCMLVSEQFFVSHFLQLLRKKRVYSVLVGLL